MKNKQRKKRKFQIQSPHSHPTSLEMALNRLVVACEAADRAIINHDRFAAAASPLLVELGFQPDQFIPDSVATTLLLADRQADAHLITSLIHVRGERTRAIGEARDAEYEFARMRGFSNASSTKPPWEALLDIRTHGAMAALTGCTAYPVNSEV